MPLRKGGPLTRGESFDAGRASALADVEKMINELDFKLLIHPNPDDSWIKQKIRQALKSLNSPQTEQRTKVHSECTVDSRKGQVYIEAAGNLTRDGIKAIRDICNIKDSKGCGKWKLKGTRAYLCGEIDLCPSCKEKK